MLCAIEHADTVLFWMENYSKEELPPSWMWPYPDELDKHFEEVREDRDARMRGDDSSRLERNELARNWG